MSKRQDKQHSKNRLRQTFRSESPKYDRYARQRKPDPAAEELIRFVREYQKERQPTVLRLQKLAPLPCIGQSQLPVIEVPSESNFVSTSINSLDESDADDGLGDSYPDVDDDLDSEVASCTDSFATIDDSFSNHGMHHTQVTSGTLSSKKKSKKRGKSKKSASAEQTLTPLVTNGPGRAKGNLHGRKLPPLIRDDLFDRPCAPMPSYAKESPYSPDKFIMEEDDPVDYIE